jgi:hypothetical protein
LIAALLHAVNECLLGDQKMLQSKLFHLFKRFGTCQAEEITQNHRLLAGAAEWAGDGDWKLWLREEVLHALLTEAVITSLEKRKRNMQRKSKRKPCTDSRTGKKPPKVSKQVGKNKWHGIVSRVKQLRVGTGEGKNGELAAAAPN